MPEINTSPQLGQETAHLLVFAGAFCFARRGNHILKRLRPLLLSALNPRISKRANLVLMLGNHDWKVNLLQTACFKMHQLAKILRDSRGSILTCDDVWHLQNGEKRAPLFAALFCRPLGPCFRWGSLGLRALSSIFIHITFPVHLLSDTDCDSN